MLDALLVDEDDLAVVRTDAGFLDDELGATIKDCLA